MQSKYAPWGRAALSVAAALFASGCASNIARKASLLPTQAHAEVAQPGVVLIAFGRANAVERTMAGWIGGTSKISPEIVRMFVGLTRIQLEIAAKAASISPVVLLANDADAAQQVEDMCGLIGNGRELCDALKSGRVQVRETSHSGPWIRDYGPFVFHRRGTTHAVDARYSGDPRSRRNIERQRAAWNQRRFNLLQKKQSLVQSQDALRSDLNAEIETLHGLIEASKEPSLHARSDDDESFASISKAVLALRHLRPMRSTLAIEGGNLLRLEDGNCLTSTDLGPQNEGAEDAVRRTLSHDFGCRDTIFLDPLPGEVIKHVDMFVLPVARKTVLLASYEIGDDVKLASYYDSAPPTVRRAIRDAAVAMKANRAELIARGYEVIEIPSPPPLLETDGTDMWYPTVLNALVHSGADAKRQVIAPAYDGVFEDIQASAQKQITAAFGDEVAVHFVESTAAAKLQGAVHCLTLIIPTAAVLLTNPRSSEEETTIRKFAELDRKIKNTAVNVAAAKRLNGVWHHPESGMTLLFSRDQTLTVRTIQGDYSDTWEVQQVVPPTVANQARYELRFKEDHASLTWTDEQSFDLQIEGTDVSIHFVEGTPPTPPPAPPPARRRRRV